VSKMPVVTFICVKCGYKHRCEAKTYDDSFSGVPEKPMCFQGLIDENGDDKSEFEYITCNLDEI
jgi:hypothetical protein